MPPRLPLPDDKRLTVVFSVEPGCLGPTGLDHVDRFCKFSLGEFNIVDYGFIRWEVVPRHDKAAPEIQYRIQNKLLPRDKAGQFLKLFHKNIDAFEGKIYDKITHQIDEYFGR